MATFLIAVFSVVLVLVCLFVTLLILMQKPSANSGMGAALGGGAAEQAFGGEASNVLTKGTIYAIIAFFVISFGLYLGTLATVERDKEDTTGVSISQLEGNEPKIQPDADGSAEAQAGVSALEGEESSAGEVTGESLSVDPQAPVVEEDANGTAPAETLQLEDLDKPKVAPAGS